MSRLAEKYKAEVVPVLRQEFNYSSAMQVPRLVKVTLNMGLGEAIANPKVLESAVADLALIGGQKPVITKAKRSIAAFKLRKGMQIGAMVTLRRERMWNFLDQMISVALPQVRDFRGLPRRSFDGRGNYTLGIKEHTIFPTVSYEQTDKVRGLNISIQTTAQTDEEAMRLLELMGFPFRRN